MNPSVIFENYKDEGNLFHIEVIQSPTKARNCGFGNHDKRPIDPPPVVRLRTKLKVISQERLFQYCQKFVVKCNLCHVDQELSSNSSEIIETMIVSNPNTKEPTPNLTGNTTVSPFVYFDGNINESYIVFVFSRLYVRTQGSYKLVFYLYPVTNDEPTPSCSVAMSDPFNCYLPSCFPGVDTSTVLTRDLKEQGVAITIHDPSSDHNNHQNNQNN